MKLQYLAVIFIIIIIPIVMVLSEYIDYHIDAVNMKHTYNTKLLDATYDSLKAYQLNTVNNAISDISASKIEDLEAAVKTFFNSLTTNFNYSGYNSQVMKEYVPAVAFTMYDGYYIYSPYHNILTGVPSKNSSGDKYVDEDYDKEILNGIKPYVYYSCRYKKGTSYDVVITYTLDNYITIQGIGSKMDGDDKYDNTTKYINYHGYLIDGIKKIDDKTYKYDCVTFNEDSNNEILREYLGNKEYPYVKLNGTKYYLDNVNNSLSIQTKALNEDDECDEIFYINATGERATQVKNNKKNADLFEKYRNLIVKNNSAYKYYRDSYNFTKYVHDTFGTLESSDAIDENGDSIADILESENYFSSGRIFDQDTNNDDKTESTTLGVAIQDTNSNFNAHRAAVIRYTIQKNLAAAIAGFKNYSNADNAEFIMPEISDTDWDTLQNNVSIITFLQGFKIGGRDYNKYCVVANNLTKEYVDEDDIYILDKKGMYHKPNDTTIDIKTGLGYQPGIWKLNFERKNYRQENDDKNYENHYYYPVIYDATSTPSTPYLGSYSSVISHSTSLDNSKADLYKYMREPNDDGAMVNSDVKKAYYTALARERYGAFFVNNDIDVVKGQLMTANAEAVSDTQNPNVELIITGNKSNGWYKDEVRISGKANDNSRISKIVYKNNSTGSNKEALPNTTNWEGELETISSTSTGIYTVSLEATDGSDRQNKTRKDLTVYIDNKAPEIELTYDEENKKIKVTKVSDEHSKLDTYYWETPYGKIEGDFKNNNVIPSIKASEKGDYALHVFDKAGNEAIQSYTPIVDETKPIVRVVPPREEQPNENNGVYTKTKDITIYIEDINIEKNNRKCYLSKGVNEYEEEGSISFEYNAGEKFTLKNNGYSQEELTGTYYLWSKPIEDEAGNRTEHEIIDGYIKLGGPYYFDNTKPQKPKLEMNGEVCKTTDAKITLSDVHSGIDNLDAERTCYLSTREDQNTEDVKYKYKSGQPVTLGIDPKTGNGLTGKYFVWTDEISDKAGNKLKGQCLGSVVFDNSGPTVTVEPENDTTYTQKKNIKITIWDRDREIYDNQRRKCYLSTRRDIKKDLVEYEYTSGQLFEAGEGLTGIYYLWIDPISDELGNVTGESKVAGPYYFDNTKPSVELNTTYTKMCKSTEVTIKLSDGHSGLLNEDNTGRYYLSTKQDALIGGTWNQFTSKRPFTIGTDLTGTYYLWIDNVYDKANNNNELHCVKTFKFDNKGPEVEFKIMETKETGITVQVDAEDKEGSDISSYEYSIKIGDQDYSSPTTIMSNIISNKERNTYTYTRGASYSTGINYSIRVIVWDALGNKTEKVINFSLHSITYDFSDYSSETLYKDAITEGFELENKELDFKDNKLEYLYVKGSSVPIYSQKILRQTKVEEIEKIWVVTKWNEKDNSNNVYELDEQYTINKNLTLVPIWENTMIKLDPNTINVNVNWHMKDTTKGQDSTYKIDIDTHTYIYENTNTQLAHVHYGDLKFGKKDHVWLDRDDTWGWWNGKSLDVTGENTKIKLLELNNDYSDINRIRVDANVFSPGNSSCIYYLREVPELKVTITTQSGQELFSYKFIETKNRSSMTAGTLNKDIDGIHWIFEAGE